MIKKEINYNLAQGLFTDYWKFCSTVYNAVRYFRPVYSKQGLKIITEG